MIDLRGIRETLWSFATAATDQRYPWRRSDQEGPPGELPFGTIGNIRIMDLGSGSRDYAENADEPLDIDIGLIQSHEIIVSFQGYGEMASSMVAEVIAGAKLGGDIVSSVPGVDICLGFMDSTPIIDLTTVVGSRQELRAQSDLTFSFRSKYVRTVPSIQRVELVSNGETFLIDAEG